MYSVLELTTLAGILCDFLAQSIVFCLDAMVTLRFVLVGVLCGIHDVLEKQSHA